MIDTMSSLCKFFFLNLILLYTLLFFPVYLLHHERKYLILFTDKDNSYLVSISIKEKPIVPFLL